MVLQQQQQGIEDPWCQVDFATVRRQQSTRRELDAKAVEAPGGRLSRSSCNITFHNFSESSKELAGRRVAALCSPQHAAPLDASRRIAMKTKWTALMVMAVVALVPTLALAEDDAPRAPSVSYTHPIIG
ncbi:MAG TPA: hypothetical protein VFN09_04445, partial [Rhodanobacteraceae bacterium]|nr:hypothetical protein [Rhodanobacteraceae bacterium]